MDDRAIGLIGLMRRAGAIEIGEDNSGSAVSAGKAKQSCCSRRRMLPKTRSVTPNASRRGGG